MSSFDGLLERAKKNYSGSFNRNITENGSGSTQAAVSAPKSTVSTSFDGLAERARANFNDSFRSEGQRSTVVNWMERYNRVMQGISAYDKHRNGGYTRDASGGFGTEIDSLIADFEGIKDYAADYGFMNSGNYLNQLKQLQSSIQGINDNFSQFEDEDAYNRYMEYWQDQEEKKNLDLDAYSREIAALEQQLENYEPEFNWEEDKYRDVNPQQAADAEMKRMQDEINRRKQYLAQARQAQDLAALDKEDVPELERYIQNRKAARVQSFNQSLTSLPAAYEDSYLIEKYGREKLDQIAESYQREQNQQKYAASYTAGKAAAGENLSMKNAGANALSISSNLAGNLLSPLSRIADGGHSTGRYETMDPYSAGDRAYAWASGVRGKTGDIIAGDEYDKNGVKVKDGGTLRQIGSYAYQGLMSGLDSGARAIIGGSSGVAMGLAAMGSFNQTLTEASEKGASFGQAMALATANAGIEAMTEKMGLDELFHIAEAGKKPLKQVIRNVLKQAGVEAAEEEVSLIGSLLAEAAILKEKSGYNQQIAQLMQNGMTEAEARRQTNLGILKEAGETFLVSAFSGGISGGGAEAYAGVIDRIGNPDRNATPALEKSTPGGVTEKSSAVDDKKKATEAVAKNATTTVGVSKMETVQQTADIESFAQQFGTQADAVRRNYMEGQDLQEYEVGFQTAYAMGLEGGKAEALGSVPYLSQSQREIAFSLGRDAAAAQKAAAPKKAALTAKMTTEEGTQDVTIAEVVDMDDTTMTFRLEDGRTVTDNDLDFEKGQKLMAAAWELGMDVKTVNTIVTESAANTAADADQAAGIQQAHHYGQHGYTMEQLTKHGTDAAALTDGQRKAAWEAGRQIYLQKAAEPAPALKAPKTSGVWFDNGGGDVIAFDDYDVSGLSETAVAGARAAQVLQKLGIGRNYYFFESYKNKAGERVYRDENGVEKKAPNGWYDKSTGSIHIDLNAGAEGKGLTLYTLSHELTHFVEKQDKQAYRRLAEFLVASYAKHTSVDELVTRKQAELSESRGVEVSYEDAYSEFIADSMEAMLSDGNVLEKLQELKKTDKSLFDKIREFFDNLARKIREIYKDLTPDSLEGKTVLQMKDQIDQIQQLFSEALVEAGENFDDAMEQVIQTNAEPVPAEEIVTDGAVVTDGGGRRYSIRSMKSDIAEGKMFEDLQTYCNWSKAQVDQLKKDLSELVDYMTPFRDVLDLNETYDREGRRFSAYKPNSDPLYHISMDFSTLCSKRLLTQFVIENLQLRENRPMTAEEQMAIRDMLIEYRKQEKGLQVACAMCYVEAARLKSPKQMQRWMNDPETYMRNYFADKDPDFAAYIKSKQEEFKESRGYKRNIPKKDMKPKDRTALNNIRQKVRAEYKPTASEQAIIDKAKSLPNSTYLTAANLANLSESDPAIYAAYTAFIRNATRSKSLETDEPYYYGDSRRDNGNGIIVSDRFVEAVNRENGMRFSSWSDWRIQHMLDYITAVIDNAVRGAAMHGYTKFPEEVRVLGNTGMMFNLSGVAGTQNGLNPDGSLSFSETESIDINEAIQLRKDFPETAGLQCIGVSDVHIVELLKSDVIDYVIPYHISGLNKALRTMADIQGWKDYTGTQHASIDHSVKLQDAADPEHWHEEPVFSEFFVGYDTGMTGIEAMQESAERYRQMCHDRGLIPKFNQFYEKGNNYWKLLIDRKMINQKTGKLIQQKPVTPTFDFNEIKAVVKRHVDNYDSNMEARALNHIVENWDSIPGRIKELKKGKKKAAPSLKAVNEVANQMLAAQGQEKYANRMYSDRKKASGFKDYDITATVYEIRNEKAERGHDLVKIGTMPTLYHELFGLDGDVYVSNSHLYQNMVSRTVAEAEGRFNLKDHADYHDLGEEKIINAIDQFQDPLLLMESLKDFNEPRLVALVDEKGNDGQNLIAVLELYSPIRAYGSPNMRSHVLMTIYEKNSLPDYIEKTVDKGRILHKKQGLHQLRQADLQLVGDVTEETLKKNVARFNKKVKEFKAQHNISYQDRAAGTSNRDLLAGAFEELARNPDELEFLREYKENVGKLNEQDRKLQEIRTEIREQTFGKGLKDPKRLAQLQEEARKTANRIDIYDKKLLRLEATVPLQRVLQRESSKAYKQGKEKSKQIYERRKDRREQAFMRQEIRKIIKRLDTLLKSETKEKHVPDSMKKAVAEALSLINDIELGTAERRMDALSTEVQSLKQKLSQAMGLGDRELVEEFQAQLDEKLIAMQRYEKSGGRLLALRDAYADIRNSTDPDIAAGYDAEVAGALAELSESLKDTSFRDMSKEQLQDVLDMYTMVLTRIRDANKQFGARRGETLQENTAETEADIRKFGISEKDPGIVADKLGKLVRGFSWNNLRPVDAFHRLGSRKLEQLYMDLVDGMAQRGRQIKEIGQFITDIRKKTGYKSFNLKEAETYTTVDGKDMKLTLAEKMSIYAYSKRDQAYDHMVEGGFTYAKNLTYKENGKTKVHTGKAKTWRLSMEDLQTICGSLTEKQRQYVDAVQQFLTEFGTHGDKVNMELYGIKLFNKENAYFPLQSDRDYRKSVENQLGGTMTAASLKSDGMTKKTVPGANNPIVLEDFDRVVFRHLDKMANYANLVLPLENLRRVFDYQTSASENQAPASMKALIGATFGREAQQYVEQFLTDANGTRMSMGVQNPLEIMFTRSKGMAVAANLSVMIQQISAVVRAVAEISPKHLMWAAENQKGIKLYDEMVKYAPIAIIKDMGGFDTGSNRSLEDYIGFEEAPNSAKKVWNNMQKLFGMGAETMDKVGWCLIWNGVKREVASRQQYEVNSEKFLQECGKRFTEVIVKTQVYDSVLSRSGYMRDKHGTMRYLTSFMGEPTVQAGMVFNSHLDVVRAIQQKKDVRLNVKRLIRTDAALISALVVNGMLKAIPYAMRDDDEDEGYWERWAKQFGSALSELWKPWELLPILRNIDDLASGRTIEQPDMALLSDLLQVGTKVIHVMQDEEAMADMKPDDWYALAKELAGSVGNLLGVPVKNIWRDAEGYVRIWKDATDGIDSDGMLLDAMWRGLKGEEKTKHEGIYDAMVRGDTARLDALKSTYKTDSSYESAVRKALRLHDPRIREMANARYEGDYDRLEALSYEIEAEGIFDMSTIRAAYEAERTAQAKDRGITLEEDSAEKAEESTVFSMEEYYAAIRNGSKDSIQTAYNALIEEKKQEYYLEREAEDSIVSSVTGKVKGEYLDEDISRADAKSILTKYGGKSKAEAETEIKKWEFQMEYHYAWGSRDRCYRSGTITRSQLVNAVMDIEDASREEAQEYVDFLELEMENQDIDITASEANSYFEHAKPHGISVDVYLDYKERTTGIENDKDANGKFIRYSAVKKIMAVIDSLPLTDSQKLALAESNGWADSTIQEYKTW